MSVALPLNPQTPEHSSDPTVVVKHYHHRSFMRYDKSDQTKLDSNPIDKELIRNLDEGKQQIFLAI